MTNYKESNTVSKDIKLSLRVLELTKSEAKKYINNTNKCAFRWSFQIDDTIGIAYDFIKDTNIDKIKIINIESLFNNGIRKNGFGSEILSYINTLAKDDTIILGSCYASKTEYEEEPTDEEYDELFTYITKFYNKNNFEDVTELFGTYDGTTSRTFILKNHIGKELISFREKYIKEWEEHNKKEDKA